MKFFYQKKRFAFLVMLFLCLYSFGSYAQTITNITSTKVTSNWEGAPNLNNGGCISAYIDAYPVDQENIFIEFDLSSLDSYYNITSANLRLVQGEGSGENGNIPFNVYRVTTAWAEGTGNCFQTTNDGVTWNNSTGATTWTTPGGDYAGTVYGSATGNHANPTGTLFNIDITTLAQEWLNGTHTNYGLVLVPQLEDTSWFNIYSDDAASSNNRPRLEVTQEACSVSAVVDVVRPLCGTNTGEINITNSSGANDFEYRLDSGTWQTSPNFTGLAANTYSVSMRNANNTACTEALGNYTIVCDVDTDGDGVVNTDDFDSDNDGILDTVEGACPNGTASKPITDIALAHNFSSGRYYFDLGNGLFQANIDASEGGGWVLLLQYLHQGGTNPALNVITENANLPIRSNRTLGTDESSDLTRWGHAGNARTANLTGANELRFYGQTSGHSRIIHFKTDQGLNYARTGTGNMSANLAANFTALSLHNANIPAATNSGFSNQGNIALTEFPFYRSANFHWGIKGRGDRWEVDDFPNNSSRNTIHRVWIRNSVSQTCTATDTDNDGTPDYLDLDSDGDGCSDANEYYNNVNADGFDDGVYGTGMPAVDADGLVVDAGYNGSGYAAVIDNTTMICVDTDGDDLADSVDLDSDNDGILDCVENRLDGEVGDYFSLNGDASQITSNEFQLTPASGGSNGLPTQSGQAWLLDKISFQNSFSFTFDANLGSITDTSEGGDGIAIVFHDDPTGTNATGSDGSGLGAAGIQYGLVLEIDTYDNTFDHSGELSADHSAIWDSDASGTNLPSTPMLSGPISFGELEDGAWHEVVVTWNLSTQTLSYTIDGVNAGSITGDLPTLYFNGSSSVTFGFTASTGYARNDHRVRLTSACDLPVEVDDDNDGISNYLDTDSDNDGIFDALEADPTFNPTNVNVQGRITGGVDSNGVPSLASGGFTPVDTDSNGIPNYLDLDSDGDNCSDANEYYNNPSADGGDDRVFGIGTPTVDINNGLVVGAGYNGTGLANVINNLVSSGCDPYIFESTGTWETQANWNFNRLPTAIDTAFVRANSNVTLIQEVGTLTIDPAFIVSIDTLQTLHIKENLTNNGNVDGQGYLVLDGLSAQEITGTGSFTYLRLDNTNGATLNDNVDLTGVLDLQDGVFTIASTKFLTFKSNATKTAVLSEVAATSDILGCVIVERYIQPNRRAFRYIASAVNTITLCGKESIQDNLQEGNQVVDYTSYPGASETPGFGTHITGSTAGNFGFDATQTGNPSMFSWNQNTQGWNAIPNTLDTGANTLDIGNSYALMIRGGRELNLNVSNSVTGQDPTTLRFTGELTTGDVVVNNLATGSGNYSFIANPYQAQVDVKELMDSGNVTNVKTDIIYIYDPTINIRGGYATVDLASGNPVPIYSKANKFLQPNQSMFVENTGPSPSLTFIETFKKNLNLEFTNGTFSIDDAARLDITLKRKDNSTFTVADGVRLYFDDSFDNAIQNNDANKLWNSDESLAIKQTDKYLSIERRKYPTSGESVQLSLFNSKSDKYQFEFDAQDFKKTAYLKDHYTENLQEIENDAVSIYTFMANRQIPESVATTRFELVFEETTLGVEDINFEDIRVYPNPASEILHIQIPNATGENYRLRLTDMAGRLIFTESVKAVNGRISTRKIENLQRGVYLINIEMDGQDYTKKLIIN